MLGEAARSTPAPSCEPQRSPMATAAWWKESSGRGTTARSCPGLILQVFHPNECRALTTWYLPHQGGIFLKALGAKSEGETRQLQVVLVAPQHPGLLEVGRGSTETFTSPGRAGPFLPLPSLRRAAAAQPMSPPRPGGAPPEPSRTYQETTHVQGDPATRL